MSAYHEKLSCGSCCASFSTCMENTKTRKEHGGVLSLYLCTLSAVLYQAFSAKIGGESVRELLFGGLIGALFIAIVFALVLLLKRKQLSFLQTILHTKVVRYLGAFCLFSGAIQVLLQQERLYFGQFYTGYVWVLCIAILSCSVHCTQHAFGRCARLLLLICAVVGVLCAVGLCTQSSLWNLVATPLTQHGVQQGVCTAMQVYPEYLLLLFWDFKAQEKPILRLPFYVLLLQLLFSFSAELIFGAHKFGYMGGEVFRNWAFLSFSRFDAIIVLLWMLTALFRMRFLVFAGLELCKNQRAESVTSSCDGNAKQSAPKKEG